MTPRIPPMAIDCQWLRRTIDSSRTADPYVMMCMHIVREGDDCVGPFLDDVETDCKLWEANERIRAPLRAHRTPTDLAVGSPDSGEPLDRCFETARAASWPSLSLVPAP